MKSVVSEVLHMSTPQKLYHTRSYRNIYPQSSTIETSKNSADPKSRSPLIVGAIRVADVLCTSFPFDGKVNSKLDISSISVICVSNRFSLHPENDSLSDTLKLVIELEPYQYKLLAREQTSSNSHRSRLPAQPSVHCHCASTGPY